LEFPVLLLHGIHSSFPSPTVIFNAHASSVLSASIVTSFVLPYGDIHSEIISENMETLCTHSLIGGCVSDAACSSLAQLRGSFVARRAHQQQQQQQQ
jgi:hypothetical protein